MLRRIKNSILLIKSAKLYNFCAALLMLRTTANCAQNSAHAKLQNSGISILND